MRHDLLTPIQDVFITHAKAIQTMKHKDAHRVYPPVIHSLKHFPDVSITQANATLYKQTNTDLHMSVLLQQEHVTEHLYTSVVS